MKWNNIDNKPSFKNREKFLGEWLILIGTDGSLVGPVLYNVSYDSFKSVCEVKEVTHWMYPNEVFSPNQMLKLTEIMKNPCCHETF